MTGGESYVMLREVQADDLPIFFEHQRDPSATQMADFPAREREPFLTHWEKNILGNAAGIARTVVCDGRVAGNIVCWEQEGQRLVGYWLGREFWGAGHSHARAGRVPEARGRAALVGLCGETQSRVAPGAGEMRFCAVRRARRGSDSELDASN